MRFLQKNDKMFSSVDGFGEPDKAMNHDRLFLLDYLERPKTIPSDRKRQVFLLSPHLQHNDHVAMVSIGWSSFVVEFVVDGILEFLLEISFSQNTSKVE